jgi:putative hydrolase of the HAD superfamily
VASQKKPVLWLVDLDNTLYDASWRVMGEINVRMTRYISEFLGIPIEQASRLRERYWHRYGATLLGLIAHHGVNAQEFLKATHPNHELPAFVRPIRGERARLLKLAGERWLLTNAPYEYAEHVLRLIGLRHCFTRIVTIDDMVVCGRLCPKPSVHLMRRLLRLSGRKASGVVLIDDHDENLKSAHRVGLRTARIWASKTAKQRARASGRPLSIRRPSYVKVQVNSLASMVRSQYPLA